MYSLHQACFTFGQALLGIVLSVALCASPSLSKLFSLPCYGVFSTGLTVYLVTESLPSETELQAAELSAEVPTLRAVWPRMSNLTC